ncbi:zinc finger (CCCH type) motif-containing protein [Besnoitia besnoiti]|uniref:Zinc finger (CCCH type) motif-containing protein n=1 Tax=Besnoitia besnoiti TaxID=94643 RepID=A0A2A9M462_BESBE|nr:zinc finger (CCCH type) motif-containing protein [Besnoitia besnoiti]PFH32739.1 zinc finger (CCCH type) motif-containing protein [Besnoitia besnoiti]
MSAPPPAPNGSAASAAVACSLPPLLPPSYPFSSFSSPSLALSAQARALLPLLSSSLPASGTSLQKKPRKKRRLCDFVTHASAASSQASPLIPQVPSGGHLPPASALTVTDNRFQFSFEPSLEQQKQEEVRLLNEQGIARADCVSGRQWGRHTVVCRHWWKGMCMKGEFCDFLHQLIYHRMPACRNQLCCPDTRRGCCPFRHEEAAPASAAGGPKGPPGAPASAAVGDGASALARSQHEADDGGKLGAAQSAFAPSLPDFTSTDYVSGGATGAIHQQECVNYFLGFCKLGPKCRRKHTARNRRDIPPILPSWFLEQILANPQVFPTELDPESQEQLSQVIAQCRQLSQAARAAVSGASGASHAGHGGAFASSLGRGSSVSRSAGVGDGAGGSRSESQPSEGPTSAFRALAFASSTHGAGGGGLGRVLAAQRDEHGAPLASGLSSSSCALLAPSTTCAVPLLVDPLGQPASPQSTKRFFIIKSNRMSNIYTSIQHGVWATSKGNTRKLINAFNSTDHILLLFSANESGGFQGFGRMMSLPDPQLFPGIWGPVQLRLGGNFRVMWLKQCKVEFEELGKVTNPWNDDLPLRKSRDGTEVPPALGSLLCTAMAQRASEDLLAGTGIDQTMRIDHTTFFAMLLQNKLLPLPPSRSIQGTLQPTAPIELRDRTFAASQAPVFASTAGGGTAGGEGGAAFGAQQR